MYNVPAQRMNAVPVCTAVCTGSETPERFSSFFIHMRWKHPAAWKKILMEETPAPKNMKEAKKNGSQRKNQNQDQGL